jgi:hypothetical protein
LTKDEELECIRKWISEADENKYEKWVMELKATGEVVGNIDVNTVVKKHNYCNVGYTVRYNYWGNGYAAEALKAVAEHLLNNRGYYLVECSCNELNVQSFRVMEKAGFTKDEIMQMAQPTVQNPNAEPVQTANDNPAPVTEPVNQPAQVNEPVAVPAPTPAPAPVQQPVQTDVQNQPTMADIMQGIAKLTSAVQANAIAQSVIPQGLQNPPSAEDMLAEIIRPTFKERG